MLINSLLQIASHACIQCAITFVCHNINCWLSIMHFWILINLIIVSIIFRGEMCFADKFYRELYSLMGSKAWVASLSLAMTRPGVFAITPNFRKFLLILPVAGLVRLRRENNKYKIKINKKIIKIAALKWNSTIY